MTTATLFATLRTQRLPMPSGPAWQARQSPRGHQTVVDALEDAVRLTEQRGAAREAARFGEMLRHERRRPGEDVRG